MFDSPVAVSDRDKQRALELVLQSRTFVVREFGKITELPLATLQAGPVRNSTWSAAVRRFAAQLW